MTRESPEKLMFGGKIRRKLPDKISPDREQAYDPNRERDEAKKEQMKAHADERRHARQSTLKIGDLVLLKQNKWSSLTIPYDPQPYAVIVLKGSMNSFHCKVLRFAEREEYDVSD